jgi:hypothetical protein
MEVQGAHSASFAGLCRSRTPCAMRVEAPRPTPVTHRRVTTFKLARARKPTAESKPAFRLDKNGVWIQKDQAHGLLKSHFGKAAQLAAVQLGGARRA